MSRYKFYDAADVRWRRIPASIGHEIDAAISPDQIEDVLRRHESDFARILKEKGQTYRTDYIDCDEMANTMSRILEQRGIPHEVIVGFNREGSAHAWVRTAEGDHDPTDQGMRRKGQEVVERFDSEGGRRGLWPPEGSAATFMAVGKGAVRPHVAASEEEESEREIRSAFDEGTLPQDLFFQEVPWRDYVVYLESWGEMCFSKEQLDEAERSESPDTFLEELAAEGAEAIAKREGWDGYVHLYPYESGEDFGLTIFYRRVKPEVRPRLSRRTRRRVGPGSGWWRERSRHAAAARKGWGRRR